MIATNKILANFCSDFIAAEGGQIVNPAKQKHFSHHLCQSKTLGHTWHLLVTLWQHLVTIWQLLVNSWQLLVTTCQLLVTTCQLLVTTMQQLATISGHIWDLKQCHTMKFEFSGPFLGHVLTDRA